MMNINPNSSLMLRDNHIVDTLTVKAEGIEEKKEDELMEVCQEFESIFLYMMMKEMRKNVPESGLIERSHATVVFEEMYMEEMAKEISKTDDGVGLAKMMYDQLKGQDKIILD